MPGWINVPVKIETRNRLDLLKVGKESYDKIINEMIDKIDNKSIAKQILNDPAHGDKNLPNPPYKGE